MIIRTPIVQNDRALATEPSIKPYGCLWRSLVEIPEEVAGQPLNAATLLELYRWLVREGGIRDDANGPGADGKRLRAYVLDHQRVGRAAQHFLGAPQTFQYVYRNDVGSNDFDFGSRDLATHFIARVRCEGFGISHFIRSDGAGNRLWDPYWPAHRITDVLSLRGYRV